MNRINRIIPVRAGFALLLAVLLAACSSLPSKPQSPRVSLAGLNLVSVDLFEQRYQARLRIKNPNSFALPVQGIDFHLAINGEDFADGVGNQSVTIPAYGEKVMALEVSSNLLQVLRQLKILEDRELGGFEYRITGNIASGRHGWRLPFDFTGRLEAPGAAGDHRAKSVADWRTVIHKICG
ncbi:MAG: LEA type 2 family protein [Thiogranum sp.]|nr:LEA type 2 family protein [Thiogranum sp.]